MQALGGQQRKAVAEIVPVHATEDRQGTGPRAITPGDAAVEYIGEQSQVLLLHR